MLFLGKPWGSWLLSLAVLVALGFGSGGPAQQAEDSRYFPETGHTVRGRFLVFFDERGGLATFGFPITEEFTDPRSGLTVQYFQRSRFELHPDNPEAYVVQLGLVGEQLLAERETPLRPARAAADNNPGCRYFPETGHNACYLFLTFYDDNGGLDVFGYPLTEIMVDNSRLVQYFQRARMEWYPERPAGQRVQLGMLGRLYYDLAGLDEGRLPPNSATLREVTALTVHASVENPITGQGHNQTVYVYVVDQQAQPVAGAQVTVIAHLPGGDQAFQLAATGDRGTTSVTFDIGQATPGDPILLDVTASFGPTAGDTRTSFLPWW